MPVYGKEKCRPVFSGRRIERGLYSCKEGYCINADCNGAANILRKAIPDAWKGVSDFHFLATPESIGFAMLNPADIKDINSITTGFSFPTILLAILADMQHSQIMRLYARALKAKHRPKYSLGIICQWIGGLVNSPLLARSAYGSFVLCSRDESDTASRTKPFIGNS